MGKEVKHYVGRSVTNPKETFCGLPCSWDRDATECPLLLVFYSGSPSYGTLPFVSGLDEICHDLTTATRNGLTLCRDCMAEALNRIGKDHRSLVMYLIGKDDA